MEIEYTDQLPYNGDSLWHNRLITDYNDELHHYRLRDKMVKQYAWAIPTEEALTLVASFSPLVEIGAGTGYWAYELRKRGANIHAYDQFPADGSDFSEEEMKLEYGPETNEERKNIVRKNWYHRGHPAWTDVRVGTPEILREYNAAWNLFLCWPPYDDPMATDALCLFRGRFLIYIGESQGGCNADDRFFQLLQRRFDYVDTAHIPSWPGIHDGLTVYERKR